MKLKTLKDLESVYGRAERELRAEAIKWEEEVRERAVAMRKEPEAFAVWVIWFIGYIFNNNITEEELKDE